MSLADRIRYNLRILIEEGSELRLLPHHQMFADEVVEALIEKIMDGTLLIAIHNGKVAFVKNPNCEYCSERGSG